ncbi:MAG: hypothetical protein Q7U74_11040, partial [Saprospiraceae bacterium]|nr:hypothetical protein [Saprospiraceae bacterium]
MSRFSKHNVREVTSLDGVWDFAYLGDVDPDRVDPQTIIFADFMAVPGCFDATPAFAGKRGLAAYRTRLMLKEAVPYRLVFYSVHHWCRVFANGLALKDHAGGFGRFQVDVPVQLSGPVELVVLVDNRFNSQRSPLHLNHFDWYQYGGIARPVELHKLGNLWIENVRVVTDRIDLPTLRVFFDYRTAQPG